MKEGEEEEASQLASLTPGWRSDTRGYEGLAFTELGEFDDVDAESEACERRRAELVATLSWALVCSRIMLLGLLVRGAVRCGVGVVVDVPGVRGHGVLRVLVVPPVLRSLAHGRNVLR